MRNADGSAGDADYGRIGPGYRAYRRPEPEFTAAIMRALGGARTVVNVGAGAGSYEPDDREVTAVEPSAAMRAQRPPHLPPAVDAVAAELPFADGAFDAAMATFSVHQWPDLAAGLRELRRVARGPVVVMTADPARVRGYWLAEYAPTLIETEARRYPEPDRIAALLGGRGRIERLPIPLGCVDGFNEAYYGRPEALLDPGARRANSAWSLLPDGAEEAAVERLRADLETGEWERRYGAFRTAAHFDGPLVLVVAEP